MIPDAGNRRPAQGPPLWTGVGHQRPLGLWQRAPWGILFDGVWRGFASGRRGVAGRSVGAAVRRDQAPSRKVISSTLLD